MGKSYSICIVLFLISCSFSGNTQTNPDLSKVFPEKEWQKITPEEVGYSSKKLDRAKTKFEEIGGVAALIVVKGYVIADWGMTEKNFDCRSFRKSFLSSLYGIYQEEGAIDINKTLGELQINDGGKLNANELQTQVKYLMSSSSGIYLPAAFEEASNRAKPERGLHQPGEHFQYNNWDFNALSNIFNDQTGKDLFLEFQNRIASPIGMEHFDASYNTGYFYQPALSEYPAYIFQISTKDMARFGLLYLNEGNWNGNQIVPKEWVIESTKAQIETGDKYYYNYGYLWWVTKSESNTGRAPFLARGAQSQYMYIDPANELIVIFRDNPDGTLRVKKSDAYPLIGSVYGAMLR
ncbi:serine hydrolase domain-containing protein [Ekhidna sp.]|uniref:serine hydrolase domain-containing protein n=1 Tax=Ekhidna sp. TaxID=2608089 RepID=UPI003B50C635